MPVSNFNSPSLRYDLPGPKHTINWQPSKATYTSEYDKAKIITTIVTLILIEGGLLSLDDKVQDFIPQFKNISIKEVQDGNLVEVGIAKTPVTIYHILTHSAGIGGDSAKDKLITIEDKKTALDMALALGLLQTIATRIYLKALLVGVGLVVRISG